MAKLLLVEDETKIAQLLEKQLRNDKHMVTWIADGQKALREISIEKFDTVILDLMLPNVSGEKILAKLRETDKSTPAIALTAKGEIDHIVSGLDGGFDDYLPKPFLYAELAARLRALLRRSTNGELDLEAGELKLDLHAKIVSRNGIALNLTNKEYQILEYLLRRKGMFVDQEELLEKLWDRNYDGFSNTVVVHLKNLKQKVDKAFAPGAELIHSERGKGYRIHD